MSRFNNMILILFLAAWFCIACSNQVQSNSMAASEYGDGDKNSSSSPVSNSINSDFKIDKSVLKVSLKQGQTKNEILSIKNTGTSILNIKIIPQDLEDFIGSESYSTETILQPDEEKKMGIEFNALENKKPDVYSGKLSLGSQNVQRKIDTVIEVDSAQTLFDVDVEVLPNAKNVLAGKELLIDVSLFNIRGFGRVDVEIEYAIMDFSGNMMAREHETTAIETQVKLSRAILVPSDLRAGTYVVTAKVAYADSVGTSSDLFDVKVKEIRFSSTQIKGYWVPFMIGAIILTLFILLYFYRRSGNGNMPKSKGEKIKQLKEESKIQKLEKELKALESGFKSGFISKRSYEKDKERVENKLNRLKS